MGLGGGWGGGGLVGVGGWGGGIFWAGLVVVVCLCGGWVFCVLGFSGVLFDMVVFFFWLWWGGVFGVVLFRLGFLGGGGGVVGVCLCSRGWWVCGGVVLVGGVWLGWTGWWGGGDGGSGVGGGGLPTWKAGAVWSGACLFSVLGGFAALSGVCCGCWIFVVGGGVEGALSGGGRVLGVFGGGVRSGIPRDGEGRYRDVLRRGICALGVWWEGGGMRGLGGQGGGWGCWGGGCGGGGGVATWNSGLVSETR